MKGETLKVATRRATVAKYTLARERATKEAAARLNAGVFRSEQAHPATVGAKHCQQRGWQRDL
jgi:hypothetical protein